MGGKLSGSYEPATFAKFTAEPFPARTCRLTGQNRLRCHVRSWAKPPVIAASQPPTPHPTKAEFVQGESCLPQQSGQIRAAPFLLLQEKWDHRVRGLPLVTTAVNLALPNRWAGLHYRAQAARPLDARGQGQTCPTDTWALPLVFTNLPTSICSEDTQRVHVCKWAHSLEPPSTEGLAWAGGRDGRGQGGASGGLWGAGGGAGVSGRPRGPSPRNSAWQGHECVARNQGEFQAKFVA